MIVNHDLKPSAEEIEYFTSKNSSPTPPMEIEIEFAPLLAERLGIESVYFEVPKGFKVLEYFVKLNPDCNCRMRTISHPENESIMVGITIDVHHTTGQAIYRVLGAYKEEIK